MLREGRLHYTLRGVKQLEGERGDVKRERLPVTPELLRQIKRIWDAKPPGRDEVMLWAACCLAFFGVLRAGELTVLALDEPGEPTILRVKIKASKTDPFRKGIFLFIGKNGSDLCPVTAMANYLLVRGKEQGPLFLFADSRYLTRQRFVAAVRDALGKTGVECSRYYGHSFRIGAATTAAARGMEDSIIKTLGRWKSLAYLEYVKIPRQQLANYSVVLC